MMDEIFHVKLQLELHQLFQLAHIFHSELIVRHKLKLIEF